MSEKIYSGVKAVILDFDNTLYDWVEQWYAGFYAFVEKLSMMSGVLPENMYSEISEIHKKHHTSEYMFLLNEMNLGKGGGVNQYRVANEEREKAQSAALRLYPHVDQTLRELKRRGIQLIVFTESQEYYTLKRFKSLGLDGLIDKIYTSKDHEFDEEFGGDIGRIRLEFTEFVSVKFGHLKPDAEILLKILEDIGLRPDEAIYVGDSLYRDVLMANDAKVPGFWARYGEARNSDRYEILRKVTHWTDEDVKRDREIRERDVTSDEVLSVCLDEILNFLPG